jgi:hypothetical protein
MINRSLRLHTGKRTEKVDHGTVPNTSDYGIVPWQSKFISLLPHGVPFDIRNRRLETETSQVFQLGQVDGMI